MAKKAKAQELPHLRVRLPAQLLARLEKSAEKRGLTLTGEIVHRLEQSFEESFRKDAVEDVQLRVATQLLDLLLDVQEGKSREEVLAKAAQHGSEIAKRARRESKS